MVFILLLRSVNFQPTESHHLNHQGKAWRAGNVAILRKVDQQLFDRAEGQHAALNLIIQHMAAAAAFLIDKMLVIGSATLMPCI